MAIVSTADARFQVAVQSLRDDYNRKRDSSKMYSFAGRKFIDYDFETVTRHTFWYQAEGSTETQCVRIYDIPGKFSGDIMRLLQDPPANILDNYEVDGDIVRNLHNPPPLPDELEPDDEDVSIEMDLLPVVVNLDETKHFTKKVKYKSEIRNLLKCQGGSCPGKQLSPRICPLLGKTQDGLLVFPKFNTRGRATGQLHSLAIYKQWILDLIEGVQFLHSLGIIHRDIRTDNLLFADNDTRVLVCDIESRWGNRTAPEIKRNYEYKKDSGWTEQSDIYDIGVTIKYMVYGNAPINNTIEWPVPPPLDRIVEACTCHLAKDRPSLDALKAMVEAIST